MLRNVWGNLEKYPKIIMKVNAPHLFGQETISNFIKSYKKKIIKFYNTLNAVYHTFYTGKNYELMIKIKNCYDTKKKN